MGMTFLSVGRGKRRVLGLDGIRGWAVSVK